MENSEFEEKVETAKARHNELKAETELENLELVLPIVTAIVTEAQAAFAKAKLAITELGLDLPLMAELSSSINVFQHNVGSGLETKTARMIELQNASSETDA